MKKSAAKDRKRVVFEIAAEPGSDVFIAGSFNDWDPTRKRLAYRDGRYRATLMLPKGKHHYKFVINGTWCVDPDCHDWVPNELGSLNSVITVG